MVIIRSITEENREDVETEICVKLTHIMRYTERLQQKMNNMIALANTLQNEDDKKEFVVFIETLKEDHDNLKKRFTEFVDFYHFEEDFQVVFSQIEAFMKQEHDKNDKLRQLCIKFLSEEDQNYLDFLSDEDDNFHGFPPLERRTEFSHDIRQPPDRDKAKVISSEDGEESEPEIEAIKKDGDEIDRFLKNLEGSSSKNEEHCLEENIYNDIQGLEEKLQSLMLPGDSSVVPQPRSNQEQDQDGKKSLIEWLKLHKNGNEDWKAMNGMRALAIDLGSNLSLLLLVFMIIMTDQEGIVEKLSTLKSTLKALSDDTLLMEKMVSVMEMVEIEAIDDKTKAVLSESLEESKVHEFIDLFFELLLHLESIVSFPSLPNSTKLMLGSVSALKCRLEQCNAQLNEVESRVNEFKKLISCSFESEKQRNLELSIVVMWDEVKRIDMAEENVEYR